MPRGVVKLFTRSLARTRVAPVGLAAVLLFTDSVPAVTGQELSQLVSMPYLALLENPPTRSFSKQEIEQFKSQLRREKEAEQKRLEVEEKQIKQQLDALRKRLDRLKKQASRDTEEMAAERRTIHCRILELERQLHIKQVERKQGVPVAYDNKLAKLDLIEQWPAKKREIEEVLASGRARLRRYGDVEDIGIRKVGEGQEKDVKLGEEAVREMKGYGLMPPEIEDQQLKNYIQRLADTIAANSDLKLPVRVTLLESEEINAFALPGGFLFVNTGLVQEAETESELVGVMAHELAHVSARHGARLMKKAMIASIIYQIVEVAALIFTGGVVSAGTYYALQYGFLGLSMALSLSLLGVSREYEEEADQLGAQYAWRAGYDPRGFITFFDKMASHKGYVKSTSFFRTHPPFFNRIVATFAEIAYLPPKDELKVDSLEFQSMKERLAKVIEELKREKKSKPTLRRMPDCDEPPGGPE